MPNEDCWTTLGHGGFARSINERNSRKSTLKVRLLGQRRIRNLTLRVVEEGFDSKGGIRWYSVGQCWQHNDVKEVRNVWYLSLVL